MAVDLQIPDSHIPKLRETYKAIYAEFWNQNARVLQEWTELYPILKKLGIIQEPGTETDPSSQIVFSNKDGINVHALGATFNNSNSPVNALFNTDRYDPAWTWLSKAQYIIRRAGRPMTSVEIIDEVIRHEPGQSRQHLINSIPATLSVAGRDGRFKREKNEKDEWIYDVVK
jgi:hypothetical protein